LGVASSADFATNSNYDPTYVAYPWLFGTGAILQKVGRVTLLRVHDVGTGFGHPTDRIAGEVVVQLDTGEGSAFGFSLRADAQEAAHRRMLDLLRDAFNRGRAIRIEYEVTGPANARLIRVIRVR
jgi:hypothetical protein